MEQSPESQDGRKKFRKDIGAAVALGVGVGVAIGMSSGNIITGVGIGVAFGLVVWAGLRQKGKSKDDDSYAND